LSGRGRDALVRNLIWDVDGTLFDTYPSIVEAFLEAVRSLGGQGEPEDARSLAREGLSRCTHVLASRYRLPEGELASRFRERYGAIPDADQPPFRGVIEVCRAIAGRKGSRPADVR
jgi:phosphoglycolate phosphatase-like HAD superfamily hydrolase